MRTAAFDASLRTTLPDATNFSGHVPPSRAGQLTEISTCRPSGNFSSVVKKTPPLAMFRVFPVPLIPDAFNKTRYLTSSFTGNLVVRLRSAAVTARTSLPLSSIACSLSRISSFLHNSPKVQIFKTILLVLWIRPALRHLTETHLLCWRNGSRPFTKFIGGSPRRRH